MNTDIPAPAPLFVAPAALADGAEFIGLARFKVAQREGRSLSIGPLLRAEAAAGSGNAAVDRLWRGG